MEPALKPNAHRGLVRLNGFLHKNIILMGFFFFSISKQSYQETVVEMLEPTIIDIDIYGKNPNRSNGRSESLLLI